MEIDRDLVEYLARLSRLGFSAEETKLLEQQLQRILGMMEELDRVDVEGVPETAHVLDLKNVLRPDEVTPSTPRDRILSNAPAVRDGCFSVPKVL